MFDIFLDKNLWTYFDFINECNVNEYDSFEYVF